MSLQAPMRCSALAEALDEPMAGSVDHRVRWLLVEDRSAWGEKAVRDVLGAELEAAARARDMRLLLIRRREDDPAADVARRAFLVDTAAARIAQRTIADLRELADLLDADVGAFGRPVAEPMLLVCANGRRDACCALRGRPLLGALAQDHGARTWECSHLGGHRFAGNLVCLPHGLVYGRVDPGVGPRLATDYLAGRVDVDHLRGRSSWPAPAQAAEVAVRRETGLDGVDDLRLVDVRVVDDAATVVVRASGRLHIVRLRAVRGEPRLTSCRAEAAEAPLAWRVVD